MDARLYASASLAEGSGFLAMGECWKPVSSGERESSAACLPHRRALPDWRSRGTVEAADRRNRRTLKRIVPAITSLASAICRALDLAEPTVKNHVTAILKAFKVTNRTEAVIAVGELK